MRLAHYIFFLLINIESSYCASFAVGNLIVERVGNGSLNLDFTATEISLLEYTKEGVREQVVNLPSSGINQITESGASYTHGQLNSYNGFIGISGYNSSVGTGSVASLNTKVTSIVDLNGEETSRTLYPIDSSSPFSGSSIRSVIPTGYNTFYASGNASGSGVDNKGIWYFDGAEFQQLVSANTRNIEIFNNELYFSTVAGIVKVGNKLPTAGPQQANYVISTSTDFYGSKGFVMFDRDNNGVLDTTFIADERSTTGGGLQKWISEDGLNWTNVYNLLVSDSASTAQTLSPITADGYLGLGGLCGAYDPSIGFTIFATTHESQASRDNNRLISISDNGTSLPNTFEVLDYSGPNYVFRGLDILTIPEPTSFLLLLAGGAMLMARRRRKRD